MHTYRLEVNGVDIVALLITTEYLQEESASMVECCTSPIEMTSQTQDQSSPYMML
jgi:hypothetical protein